MTIADATVEAHHLCEYSTRPCTSAPVEVLSIELNCGELAVNEARAVTDIALTEFVLNLCLFLSLIFQLFLQRSRFLVGVVERCRFDLGAGGAFVN